MKKISLLLISFSMSTMLMAHEPLATNQQAVQRTVINMFEALSNRDSVSLKNYCTADIQLFEYGQVWNLDSLILKAITQNQSADFIRTNKFDFLNTSISDKSALVTYRLHSVITRDGKPTSFHWLETIVLSKEKKQWRVKHLHSTLLKRS